MNKIDLEERLIDFSVLILESEKDILNTYAARHLANQMIRSGTSVSLNYGEARAAESIRDFIHKMKVILKELRETHICLRITLKALLFSKKFNLDSALKEANELISIFVVSIKTAQKNQKKK